MQHIGLPDKAVRDIISRMHGIGHNNGPTMEGGKAWRKHCWSAARAELLPKLPVEIVRRRVIRAKELGLPYKTYASVRAATGRDVIGFLFSSNALSMIRDEYLPFDRSQKLDGLKRCKRIAVVHAALDPEKIGPPLDCAHSAPPPLSNWKVTRQRLQKILRENHIAPDGVIVVGDTTLEEDWCAAAKAAGYLPADTYFATA